jgi:hypothetical protein
MEKERKSLALLGEEMAIGRAGDRSKIDVIEMTALLTVIRERMRESGGVKFSFEGLIKGVFDLTEPILFEEEIFMPNRISHGSAAMMELIGNGDLKMNPDRTITVLPELREALLATLPKKNR